MSKHTIKVAIEAYNDARQQTKFFHPNAWAAIKGDRNTQGWRRVVRSAEPLPAEIQQRMAAAKIDTKLGQELQAVAPGISLHEQVIKPGERFLGVAIPAQKESFSVSAERVSIEDILAEVNGDVEAATDSIRVSKKEMDAFMEKKMQEDYPDFKTPDFSNLKGESGILALQKDNQPAKRGRKASTAK